MPKKPPRWPNVAAYKPSPVTRPLSYLKSAVRPDRPSLSLEPAVTGEGNCSVPCVRESSIGRTCTAAEEGSMEASSARAQTPVPLSAKQQAHNALFFNLF